MHTKISTPDTPVPTVIPSDIPEHLSVVWEQYPRIGEKISLMWGYVELQRYLNETIVNDRENRNGFPERILAALIEIHNLNAKNISLNNTNPND